jgi:hypothetical protein
MRPKTSQELADMIAMWLNVADVQVAVQPDPVHGWRTIVIAPPAAAAKYQHIAEEVAKDLRLACELNV